MKTASIIIDNNLDVVPGRLVRPEQALDIQNKYVKAAQIGLSCYVLNSGFQDELLAYLHACNERPEEIHPVPRALGLPEQLAELSDLNEAYIKYARKE